MADQFQTRVPSMREILEGLRSAQTPEEIEAAKEQIAQSVSLAKTVEETPVQPKIEPMSAYSPSFSYSGPTEEEKAMQAEMIKKIENGRDSRVHVHSINKENKETEE